MITQSNWIQLLEDLPEEVAFFSIVELGKQIKTENLTHNQNRAKDQKHDSFTIEDFVDLLRALTKERCRYIFQSLEEEEPLFADKIIENVLTEYEFSDFLKLKKQEIGRIVKYPKSEDITRMMSVLCEYGDHWESTLKSLYSENVWRLYLEEKSLFEPISENTRKETKRWLLDEMARYIFYGEVENPHSKNEIP